MKDIATKSTTQYILDKYDLYPLKIDFNGVRY